MTSPMETAPMTAAMLNAPEVIRNPYPAYDRLRAAAPVFGYLDYPPGTVPGVDQPQPAWVVLSYEDVTRVAADHESFSSRDSVQEQSSAPTLMLVNHDRPEHARLRKIAARVFSAAAIEALAPRIREIVRDTLVTTIDIHGSGRPVDVMDGYCAVLPARVLAMMLRVGKDRVEDIRRWATAFMLSADLEPAARLACNAEIADFYADHVDQRLAARAAGAAADDSLLDGFIDAEVDGERLSRDEIIRFCLTATVAGAETTTFMLGNLLAVLADIPETWATLLEGPGRFAAIYDESLRFHGPPQRLFRVATRDVTIRHAEIKAGDWVACFFGAANYDPTVFPEPYRFRLDRDNGNRHVSFGYGIHRCVGAALARLEAELTVTEMLARYDGITRAAPIVWQGVSQLTHGPASNILRFAARPRPDLADMAADASPLAVTQAIFAAFAAADVDRIVALLDEAIVIEFYGPAVIPYAGSYRGRAAARRFFETVLASVDIHRFAAEEFIVEGDRIVVSGDLRLTARSTGRPIESRFVHVITVAGGRWLRFCDFMNTAVAAAAFAPG